MCDHATRNSEASPHIICRECGADLRTPSSIEYAETVRGHASIAPDGWRETTAPTLVLDPGSVTARTIVCTECGAGIDPDAFVNVSER